MWELLKDQELQLLVRIALDENLDLQIAAINIKAFQAQLNITKFDLVLSLNSLLHWQIFAIKEGGPVTLTY